MLLNGIKILDLTRLAPGPYGTMNLGDMGADVLKVEDTGPGDYMRTLGITLKEETPSFLMLNRNKRSMSLNLKTDEGREILKKLIEEYDVIIEQFRPGVMDRLGVGYEELKRCNPRIIFCSISGYGQTGPLAMDAGHDVNYLAAAGVLDSVSRPGEAPVIPGVYVGDMVSGLWAVIGILAAVFHREKTGEGQYIDVSIYEGMVSLLNMYADRFFRSGHNPGPVQRPANYNLYETADGRYVSIAAAEPKFWKNLCVALDKPEFINRLNDDEAGQKDMTAAFAEIFIKKTQAEWVELLGPADAMFSPVLNIEEAFDSEQFKARSMCWEMEHPVEGTIKSIGFPVKFKENPAAVTRRPPLYAEHTQDVLAGLGYSEEEIEELNSKGVIRV